MVADPFSPAEPSLGSSIDGDATLAYRRHLEPETLSYQITLFGPIGPDDGQSRAGSIGLIASLGTTYLEPLNLGYLSPNGFERKKVGHRSCFDPTLKWVVFSKRLFIP